ncbi:MAG: M13 family metallopeptidase [Capsulimonadales bacterium]|nr:M13 family metallopeptidase [Capsulimonadales bacterium]
MYRNFFHRMTGFAVAALLLSGSSAIAQPGVDVSTIDRSVKPTEDFYRFANGLWLDKTVIPAAYPQYGTFAELTDRSQEALRKVVEKAAEDARSGKAAPGTNARKVGDFYRIGLDEERANRLGIEPIRPELDRIARIRDVGELLETIAFLHREGIEAGFSAGPGPDLKNSSRYIANIGQGGLGLPDRDYYVKTDEATVGIRKGYQEHVAKMLALLGDSPADAAQSAERIMAIETRLAKASLTGVERRDPNASYHLMSAEEVLKRFPGVPFDRYRKTLGFPEKGDVNFAHPTFFKEFHTLLTEVPLDHWKAYLRWHLIATTGRYLSQPFIEERFRFGSAMTGQKELLPRWKRVLAVTDENLGEAIGQLYVQENFPPEAKEKALTLVRNLIGALKERITALDWMSAPTKEQALRKLGKIAIKIGYPDKWRDYSALEVATDSYWRNVARAHEFETERLLRKIGKPVDRGEWGMTPPTVNAYYNPLLNEIVFPAGILQPPFFDPKADDASNYGAIGMVIGHELTHGFDDQGRKFDAEGNLRDWWTPDDASKFQERSAVLIKQFSAYSPIEGVNVNGALTLGENIADLGGLNVAYQAYLKALGGKEPPVIAGFTGKQRFFLAFAQAWRVKTRPEMARMLVTIDPHSPGLFRVKGTLTNVPMFWEAFGADPAKASPAGGKFISIW